MNYQKKFKVISTKRLTKHLINEFSILNGAKYFSLGIFQNCLAFIPTKKNVKYFSGTTCIELWKYNWMSEESIENIAKSDSNFASTSLYHHLSADMNFNGHYLIKINISISKEIKTEYVFTH